MAKIMAQVSIAILMAQLSSMKAKIILRMKSYTKSSIKAKIIQVICMANYTKSKW